jgi:cytosine/adenosine deaminase-related metal-dependent hydrolase
MCTPTELLARQGALSARFTAVHATHLQQIDIDLYAARGCTCCFCPTTERDLADGIGPSAALRDAGVALSIGSDQHAVIDPFEEMRGIEMDERLRSRRRGNHPAAELLSAGTANGYRSLGWPDGGSIAPGALADLTTIALDGVRLAGHPGGAVLDAVVFAATAGDVTRVMVGGDVVVRDRAHRSIDVAAELRGAIAAVTGAGT